MSNPPIPYDQLFGSSSTPKEEGSAPAPQASEDSSSAPPVPYDALFGRKEDKKNVDSSTTADAYINSIRAGAAARAGVSQEDQGVFLSQLTATPAPTPPSDAVVLPPFVSDETRRKTEAPGTYAGFEDLQPGESRAQFLARKEKEFQGSSEQIRQQELASRETISAAPQGLAKFKQDLYNLRFFTSGGLFTTDQHDDSGFGVGTPFARPLETAKALVVGLPHFFADLVIQPLGLAIDKVTPGGLLTPDEKAQYTRETIANYAGLLVGGAMGNIARETMVGREFIRAGAERVGAEALAEPELAALGETLPNALKVDNSTLRKIAIGAVEGVSGGATTGFYSGRDDKERRDLAAAYAMMALPAGIAFEGARSVVKPEAELGPLAAAAAQARDLSLIKQFQDLSELSLKDATESFYTMATNKDLAHAAVAAGSSLGRPIVVPGLSVPSSSTFAHSEGNHLVYRRPDGLVDVLINPGQGEAPAAPAAIRTGPIEGGAAHFSEPGASTYFDPENAQAKGYIYPEAKIADVSDVATRDALLQESLKRATPETRTEIAGLLADKKIGLTYKEVEELGIDKAAKAIGYDGIRFFEHDDLDKPTTVNIWNLSKVEETAKTQATGEISKRDASYFELGGFVPDQYVSFLGKDYVYQRPVIDKSGALEAHVIRDASGTEFEVTPDLLRRGPDVQQNPYEATTDEVRTALFKDFKDTFPAGDQFLNSKFNDLVTTYAMKRGIPARDFAGLQKVLGDQFAAELVKNGLPPEEQVAYKRMQKESTSYHEDVAHDIVEQANSNGMFIQRNGGYMYVKDAATGSWLGSFLTPEEAKAFIRNTVQDRGAELAESGIIPPNISGGIRMSSPDPNGPHTTPFQFDKDGPLRQFSHWFNTTTLGTKLTPMYQIMIALDAQLGTEFYKKLWDDVQPAMRKRYAASHADIKTLAGIAQRMRGLAPGDEGKLQTSLETIDPTEYAQGQTNMGRPLTDREIVGAQWFKDHNIDTGKAFAYRRALIRLERRFGGDPAEFVNSVRRLQVSMNVDESHVEAARIIGSVLAKNDPSNLSILHITRLADALINGTLSPEAYMNRAGFSPRLRQLHQDFRDLFDQLAPKFNIPAEQMLGQYFPHLREYKNDIVYTDKDGTPHFTSELLRTGEMTEYERDPVNVAYRYINAGYNNLITKGVMDEAYRYVNQVTAAMPEGSWVRQILKDNYLDVLRGIPHDSSKFAQKLFAGIFDRLGIKTSPDIRKDVVNTFLSLSASGALGWRPMQGIRDLHNAVSLYYSWFGAARTADALTIMARVTPAELKQAGIIKDLLPGESTSAAMEREGTISGMSAVSVLSPGERLEGTVSHRLGPVKEKIQSLGESGLKWSLQHNVYQWMHAATILESSTRALRELNNLEKGTYGKGPEAKAKAYKNLDLGAYDQPVAEQFDALVRAGNFKGAADFLGRATSYMIVPLFGLANHPMGWATNTGRLFGQFGNWAVQTRVNVTRMASRGTLLERGARMARMTMTQGSLGLASAALGLNMSSWYLNPGAFGYRGGPMFSLIGAAQQYMTGTDREQEEAGRTLVRLPLLLTPGGYLINDIYEANSMSEQGADPTSVLLRSFGIRSQQQ